MLPTDFASVCHALVQHLHVGIVVWRLDDPAADTSLRLVGANPASTAVEGRALSPSIGKLFSEIFPSAGAERCKLYAEIVRSGVGKPLGEVARDEPGSGFALRAVPLPDRCLAIIAESRVEKREQNEIGRLNAFLDAIVENLPAMVFVKDAEHLRFELFNRAGEQLLGTARETLLGKNDFDFFPKEQAEFFQKKDREVLRSGQLLEIVEEPIDTARGRRWLHTKKIPILAEGTPKHLLGISLDITERREVQEALKQAHAELETRVQERTTELARSNAELSREIEERKRAEEQFRQAQKMEAIGRLAGGVAHDFNNLLSVILSYSSMLLSGLTEGDPLRADITEIRSAGERAANLTQQLLTFSRQQVCSPRIVDLRAIVASMDKMLRRVLGEDIELTTTGTADLGKAKLDPHQIEQVLMNLAVNARDAMPTGGRLTIETSNVQLDEDYVREHLGAESGRFIMLAVTDTGVGMDKATQARIFEPFFTTKEKGKGTGLGLSTVFGIVKQSGGSIWLYSEPGKGTTFKLYFPCSTEESLAPEVGRSIPAQAERGTETILLVEDEPQLRTLVRSILKRQGYQVLDAGNPGEALLLCERFSGAIHLLLTDVVMPQMSGHQLAERLTPLRPEMRVLYMSGYTDNTIIHHGVLEGGIHFLQKPITPDTLLSKVRGVLDG